nr:hypothetical protein CFP56_11608 [Quercus suber]
MGVRAPGLSLLLSPSSPVVSALGPAREIAHLQQHGWSRRRDVHLRRGPAHPEHLDSTYRSTDAESRPGRLRGCAGRLCMRRCDRPTLNFSLGGWNLWSGVLITASSPS